jgi:hypothetical protein
MSGSEARLAKQTRIVRPAIVIEEARSQFQEGGFGGSQGSPFRSILEMLVDVP